MPTNTDAREARLAAALRANLRKRKARDAAPAAPPCDGKAAINE